MKKKEVKTKKEKLYPIHYEGKSYTEETADDLFVSFYTCKAALRDDCSVYISDGLWVHPNGDTNED